MNRPLPIIIMKEDRWFVAICPVLDIATQGKSEKEAKENMEELIEDYLKDPDIPSKPQYLNNSRSLDDVKCQKE